MALSGQYSDTCWIWRYIDNIHCDLYFEVELSAYRTLNPYPGTVTKIVVYFNVEYDMIYSP